MRLAVRAHGPCRDASNDVERRLDVAHLEDAGPELGVGPPCSLLCLSTIRGYTTLLDLYVSSLRRENANLLCIVPL